MFSVSILDTSIQLWLIILKSVCTKANIREIISSFSGIFFSLISHIDIKVKINKRIIVQKNFIGLNLY